MANRMNPAVNDFAPNGTRQSTFRQVSVPSSPYLEARLLSLEEGHASLHEDFNHLREMYQGLSSSVERLEKGGWPVHVGPFQVDVKKSHRDAVELKLKLEKLKDEVANSVYGNADAQKASGIVTPKSNNMVIPKATGSVPLHLRTPSVTSGGTVKKSLPPHPHLHNKKVEVSNGNG